MANFFKRLFAKEDPSVYQKKDAHLIQVLTVKDFLALGVGTIVSTSIFTLPGVVAANYAGPAVAISFLVAAVVAVKDNCMKLEVVAVGSLVKLEVEVVVVASCYYTVDAVVFEMMAFVKLN